VVSGQWSVVSEEDLFFFDPTTDRYRAKPARY
jgi:hypothetical protein